MIAVSLEMSDEPGLYHAFFTLHHLFYIISLKLKNLLNVLAINLCINVADVMEDLMQDTQAISELEAILNILSLPRL